MNNERVTYWTEEWPNRNFGDCLSDYIVERMFIAPIVPADLYRLIGSVIDNDVLGRDLASCSGSHARIALWCCGKRDDRRLNEEIKRHSLFLGVRGPLTRDALDLPQDTPMGDPGLLLPLIYTPRGLGASRTICVPHFREPCDNEVLLRQSGCDVLISPAVASMEDLENLIEAIATADFVLAGSLHAAIVAAAYCRPFAYWDTGHIDVPFKWDDFAASLNISMSRVKTVKQGKDVYRGLSENIRLPLATDILGCCPFAVRQDVIAAAIGREVGLTSDTIEALKTIGNRSFLNRADRAIFGKQPYDTDDADRDSQLRAARIDRMLGDLDGSLIWLKAEAAAIRFSFADHPKLRMSAGSAGMAFLASGWSEPNDIGPWSEGKHSFLRLPASTDWPTGSAMLISGYVFAPWADDFVDQQIEIRLNDIPVFMQSFTRSTEHSRPVSMRVPIPDRLRRRGGWLTVSFSFSRPVSLESLALGADKREIAFALASIELEHKD